MKVLTIVAAALLSAAQPAMAAGIEPLPAGSETKAPIVVRFDARGKNGIDAVYEQIAAYVSSAASIERVELASSKGGKRRDLGVFPTDGAEDEVLGRLKTMTPTETRVSRNSVIDRRQSTQAQNRSAQERASAR